MKSSVLAIGTELTSGQIFNRNAQTISSQLLSFGIMTEAHLSVADERVSILRGLQFLENFSDVLFVTGGLGPTSDDFTRNVICEWAHQKLVYDEATWTYIVQRLESRGLKVHDHQKQQCYFPENGKILSNSVGTAHGFYFECDRPSGRKKVFVLPGPPTEIAAIWKDHIDPWLKKQTIDNPLIVKIWETLGIPESDLAFRIEKIFEKSPVKENLQICYRAHLPYVELKLIYPEKEKSLWESYVQVVDEALKGITVSRDFEDVAEKVFKLINGSSDFAFYDYLSSGYLIKRLAPFMKNEGALTKTDYVFVQGSEPPTADFFEDEDNFLALLPYQQGPSDLKSDLLAGKNVTSKAPEDGNPKVIVILSLAGVRAQVMLESPFKSNLMQQRQIQYLSEMALVDFVRSVGKLT